VSDDKLDAIIAQAAKDAQAPVMPSDLGIQGKEITPLDQATLEKAAHIYLEYIALADLLEWPSNPKLHDLEGIGDSMDRFGYTSPMLIDERTGHLVAGHGRLETLENKKEAGEHPPLRIIEKNGAWYVPVVRGVSFPSDEAAAAYVIGDNYLTEKGGWDQETLSSILADLVEKGGAESLDGTGYSEKEVKDLVEAAEAKEQSDGSLLEITDVSIDPPKHLVQQGDVWFIGAHVLICADVITDWMLWVQYLNPGGLFVPYPGPFAPLSDKVEELPAVFVQPDPYIAGHMLDRYAEVHGEEALDLLQAGVPVPPAEVVDEVPDDGD
jgi:hypothetical protein